MSLFGGVSDFFGLDIGADSIRVVQLGGSGSHFSLKGYGQVNLEPNLTSSDSKIDLQKVAKYIEKLLKESGIDTKNVVTAVPGTSVFTSIVTLPAMSASEVSKAIKFQAEQNIPLKLEEVKYDWQIIHQDPQTKEIKVMIVAAAKAKVNQIVEMLNYAKLNLVALETAAVGMARSLTNNQEPLVMILDIGANTTEIAVVNSGTLMQTRSFPLAGNAITRSISQGLRLDMDQAETFKMKFGLSQDKLEGQVFKAVEPVVKNIFDEAVRSAKFYQETFGTQVQRIILTGGSSRLPLLSDYLKSYTDMEVVYGNPWSKVSYQSSLSDNLNSVAPEFATAVGLAMRD